MQPLAYIAIRAVCGWLQFCERSERAFLVNRTVLVAAGTLHCWAVVYALYLAVHSRAMRYDGYHEGYTEHLPSSLAWMEYLASACLRVWMIAGFTTAAVRILDDTSPLDDGKANIFTKIVRSPVVSTLLGHAHSVSCVGLFISVLLLCVGMAMMSGGISACEFCLMIISVGFVAPHAVLAVQRLDGSIDQIVSSIVPTDLFEAAAAEAAAFGPQLCLLLSLADSPGHAYLWQNLVYLAASACFIASVACCALSPPKPSNTALPPDPSELLTLILLDGVAALSMFLSFPDLNAWSTWVAAIALFALAGAMSVRHKDVRECYMEWLEPIFVVQTPARESKQTPQQKLLRKCARVLGVVCAVTGLWDLAFHIVPHAGQVYASNHWSGHLMFKWQSAIARREGSEMIKAAADSLGIEADRFIEERTFPEHRLMLFRYNGSVDDAALTYARWQKAAASPKGELAQIVDKTFPAGLDLAVCSALKNSTDISNSTEAWAAYSSACDWAAIQGMLLSAVAHGMLKTAVGALDSENSTGAEASGDAQASSNAETSGEAETIEEGSTD